MLDDFLSLHPRLVFVNVRKMRLSARVFDIAQSIAQKPIEPPVRDLLTGAPYRRHELVYSAVTEEEMLARGDLPLRLDRLFLETVILHRLLDAKLRQDDSSPSFTRSLTVLGWMIQDRFTRLLLHIQPVQYLPIFSIGRLDGINRDIWETRLVGASAQAKAVQEIAMAGGTDVYCSTLYEDVALGIDLFVELHDNPTGVCISVKTQRGGVTDFSFTPPDPSDEKSFYDWNRIAEGTNAFNFKAYRSWRPVLLKISRLNGQAVDLSMNAGPEDWAHRLRDTLERADNFGWDNIKIP